MIDLDALIREADPARDLAVPEVDTAQIRRLSSQPPRSRRRPVDAAAILAAVAVAVGVALTVLLVGGHDRTPLKTSANSTIPAAVRPLTRILGVLRRPQTRSDRAVESMLDGQNVELGRVRVAAVTPWGERVVLAPEKGRPYGTLDLVVGSSSGVNGSFATASQIEAGHAWTADGQGSGPSRGIGLIVVVPDGVAKVSFWLASEPHFGPVSGWTGYVPRNSSVVTVPVHDNVAFVRVKQYCCGEVPVMRWYAPSGRLVKVTGNPSGAVVKPPVAGGPAINLPPGVVTVARLREPDGTLFSLTLQRIRFEGRQYVCLAVTQGPSTAQQCEGPLPLPDRPLVAVMGDPTVCKPHPAQLVWGLALTNVSVAIRSGGREQVATRRSIPVGLRARGNLFYGWARSAPDSLVARNANGKAVETYPINTASVPAFAESCKHQPTTGLRSTPAQIQTSQP
jgi:hypothetical protein